MQEPILSCSCRAAGDCLGPVQRLTLLPQVGQRVVAENVAPTVAAPSEQYGKGVNIDPKC